MSDSRDFDVVCISDGEDTPRNIASFFTAIDLTNDGNSDTEGTLQIDSESDDESSLEEITIEDFYHPGRRRSRNAANDGARSRDIVSSQATQANYGAPGPEEMLEDDCKIFGDIVLRTGDAVELQSDSADAAGDFLRIKSIVRSLQDNKVHLRGLRFRRNRYFFGMLDRTPNEVCMEIVASKTDVTPWTVQGLERVPLSNVVQKRRLRITNQAYPALREDGVLICRWMHVAIYKTAAESRNGNRCEDVVKRISEKEADEGCGVPDTWLWQEWRAGALSFADARESERRVTASADASAKIVIDLESGGEPFGNDRFFADVQYQGERSSVTEISEHTRHESSARAGTFRRLVRRSRVETVTSQISASYTPAKNLPLRPRSDFAAGATPTQRKRVYTFGDGFCGLGGVSRGAEMAGFNVVWSFDMDAPACDSYRANFPSTSNYNMTVDEFYRLPGSNFQVDVLHCSPPCQTFSPAHTIAGPNDERNEAALWCLEVMAQKCRCRVMTVEQTFGLRARHAKHYYSVMNQFTHMGFSVRSVIINCADYGLAQARKRLIIIASCPGEVLPEFPRPTHGTAPGLLPVTTVWDAIGPIPPHSQRHDPHLEKPQFLAPYNPHVPLKRCITCSGGGNYHPSGARRFTLRELACLQGIPLHHQFANQYKTTLKRQIGNAVPPVVYRKIARQIRQTLQKADDETMRSQSAPVASGFQDVPVVVLD